VVCLYSAGNAKVIFGCVLIEQFERVVFLVGDAEDFLCAECVLDKPVVVRAPKGFSLKGGRDDDFAHRAVFEEEKGRVDVVHNKN